MKKILLLICVLIVRNSPAGLLYNYSELAIKDLEQVSKIIKDKIKESRKSGGEKIIPLKEALQALYSRPNEDGMIEKLNSQIKTALDEQDAWEKAIKQLTKEAIGALKNPKAFRPITQVTYHIFLENIVSEFKPKVSAEFESGIIKQIRDAKIEITKEAKHERVLRMMKETESVSEIAKEVLLTPKPSSQTPVPVSGN